LLDSHLFLHAAWNLTPQPTKSHKTGVKLWNLHLSVALKFQSREGGFNAGRLVIAVDSADDAAGFFAAAVVCVPCQAEFCPTSSNASGSFFLLVDVGFPPAAGITASVVVFASIAADAVFDAAAYTTAALALGSFFLWPRLIGGPKVGSPSSAGSGADFVPLFAIFNRQAMEKLININGRGGVLDKIGVMCLEEIFFYQTHVEYIVEGQRLKHSWPIA
jgi:hypothetical protein